MRLFIRAAIAVLSSLMSALAAADTTTIIVPSSAGGGLDAVARIVAHGLSLQTSQSYIIDNRSGANGLIGAKAAAQAQPNGRTWLLTDSALLTVNPYLFPRDPRFDANKNLTIVAPIGFQTSVLVVNPKVNNAKTVGDLISDARKENLSYVSGGIGSNGHLTMAAFDHAAGIAMTHVPYRGGGEAMSALVSGQIGVGFVAVSVALPYIRSGALLPLAVASKTRSSQLPDVPTVQEAAHMPIDVETSFLVLLPSGVSSQTVAQVHDQVRKILANPDVQKQIRTAGMEPATEEQSAGFASWIAAERNTWHRLIEERVIQVAQ